MAINDGHAVDYTAVTRGTPIYSSDEIEVGRVAEVLDNSREHIFDGIVFDSSEGARRFVDAPEVARTAERAVTLNITAAQAGELPAPEAAAVTGAATTGKAPGLLGRLFGGRR